MGVAAAPLPSPCRTGGCHAGFLLLCHVFLPWQVLCGSHHLLLLRSPRDSSAVPAIFLRPYPLRSLQAPSLPSATHSCHIFLLSCRISTALIILSLGTTSASLKAVKGSACAEAWRNMEVKELLQTHLSKTEGGSHVEEGGDA